jgi:hypothetical protein
MSEKGNKRKPIVDKRFGIYGVSIILWSKKIHFIHIAMILILFYFTWHVTTGTLEKQSIEKNGRVIIGVIDDTRKVGGKGIRRCTYHFTVGNLRYEGSVDDDYFNVGDSIEIKFLPIDPSKNRAVKWLQKH